MTVAQTEANPHVANVAETAVGTVMARFMYSKQEAISSLIAELRRAGRKRKAKKVYVHGR